jgi:hypothetical protein
MTRNTRRYFIELQPDAGPTVPRWRETEIRRRQAERFICSVNTWLKQSALDDKVTTMAVTALGQVQIICESDLIDQLSSHDNIHIAIIRPGIMLSGNLGRL